MEKTQYSSSFLKIVGKIVLSKVAGESTLSVMMYKLPQEVLVE